MVQTLLALTSCFSSSFFSLHLYLGQRVSGHERLKSLMDWTAEIRSEVLQPVSLGLHSHPSGLAPISFWVSLFLPDSTAHAVPSCWGCSSISPPTYLKHAITFRSGPRYKSYLLHQDLAWQVSIRGFFLSLTYL